MAAFTTIDDPSAHFQATLYTGDGAANHAITNGGNSDLQPDLVWIENRDAADSSSLFDSTRGATKLLSSDMEDTTTETTDTDTLDSFASDGFQVDADVKVNTNTEDYVAWQWKANGGSRTTNTESGNNPGGGYQVNTTAGFSIVDYTGTGATGTMAHGLGAVPDLIIIKNRDVDDGWAMYHSANTSAPNTDYLIMNSTAATVDDAAFWNDTSPTSTVFTISTAHNVNADGEKYIAYCWTGIQGYSKFGKFIGNAGEPEGPFVYTGFKPAFFLMHASSEAGQGWVMGDNKRDPYNLAVHKQFANVASVDSAATGDNNWDFVSNGIKMRTQDPAMNKDGITFIYAAFAHQPFVTSEDGGSIPCTAR